MQDIINIQDIFAKFNIVKTKISLNNNQVFLAFDYGTKRIGVACGNLITSSAYPVSILSYSTRLDRFNQLKNVIQEYSPNYIIVGLPMYTDGTAHILTRACCNFGLDLYRYFNIPIIWVDERYSTSILSKKYKQYIDDQSAKLILEQFLQDCSSDYFSLT